LKLVSWIGFEPSAPQAQISKLPDRSEQNVIRFPSGAYRGAESDFEEEINIVGAAALPFASGCSARQMFVSTKSCV
jgi:hypothetical protein